jgi:hypothetical protein
MFMLMSFRRSFVQSSGSLREQISLRIRKYSWCLWRSGPTPTHLELGCETLQRREYSGGSPTER